MRIIAEDGTEFDSVDECMEYEAKCDNFEDMVITFDYDETNDKIIEYDTNSNRGNFMYVKETNGKLDSLKEFLEYNIGTWIGGINEDNCLYKYNYKSDVWEKVVDVIDRCKSEIVMIEKISKDIEGYLMEE